MSAPSTRAQEFLRTLPLFRGVTAEAIDRLASGVTQMEAPAGSVLFRRGNPCTAFYIVVQGQLKLAFSGSDGAEKVVEIFGPGEVFGEPLLFLDEPHLGFAETLTDSTLFSMGKATMLAEIDRNPRFARNMLTCMAGHLRRMVTDIEAYALKSSAKRVIGYLLRDVPADAKLPIEIRLPVAKGVLASRLSITREHFSRVLHDLAQAGLIALDGRTIRILNPAGLLAWEK